MADATHKEILNLLDIEPQANGIAMQTAFLRTEEDLEELKEAARMYATSHFNCAHLICRP